MIFTSNYARHASDPNAVAISVRAPSWYHGKQYLLLAPTWQMVRDVRSGKITDEQYDAQYFQLLKDRKLDPYQVMKDVGENAILLCYESPGEHCHRRLVAQWIQEQTGVEIPEKSLYNENIEEIKNLFEF